MFQQIIDFVRDQLANNDLAQGGLLIGAGAALMTYFRIVPNLIWRGFVYHCTVEIDIPDNQQAFKWVTKWLAHHKYSQKRARRLTVHNKQAADDSWVTVLSPAPGTHYLWDGGRFLIVTRRRKELQNATHSKAFAEELSIRVIGRNRKPALDLIDKAKGVSAPEQDQFEVMVSSDLGYWDSACMRVKRSLNSVVIHQRHQIIEDVQTFLDNSQWYLEKGIPHHRGYLFHGQPGNGKTSMVLAMASKLGYDVCVLNLQDLNDDHALTRAINLSPSNSLVVIEDIDCLFEKRDSKVNVSFAGLLNALDGLASKEGLILVMTTNYRDRLDSALIRPGRVDMEVEFKDAGRWAALQLFENFFPGHHTGYFEAQFKRRIKPISMAALQGIFIKNKDDADAAAKVTGASY